MVDSWAWYMAWMTGDQQDPESVTFKESTRKIFKDLKNIFKIRKHRVSEIVFIVLD